VVRPPVILRIPLAFVVVPPSVSVVSTSPLLMFTSPANVEFCVALMVSAAVLLVTNIVLAENVVPIYAAPVVQYRYMS